MYIFEVLFNAFKRKKYKTNSFNPLENNQEVNDEDIEACEHLFLPIDSTNEFFACKYCGLVVGKDKLKDRNIFRNKPSI